MAKVSGGGTPFQELISAFDNALTKKSVGKFSKEDVSAIFSAAQAAFSGAEHIDNQQLMQVRDKFVELAGEDKINKGRAMAKLQGTSRPDSIRSVLLNAVQVH